LNKPGKKSEPLTPDAAIIAVQREKLAGRHQIRRGEAIEIEDIGDIAGGEIGLQLVRLVSRDRLERHLDVRKRRHEVFQHLIDEVGFGRDDGLPVKRSVPEG